jgi:hypothetical protein
MGGRDGGIGDSGGHGRWVTAAGQLGGQRGRADCRSVAGLEGASPQTLDVKE